MSSAKAISNFQKVSVKEPIKTKEDYINSLRGRDLKVYLTRLNPRRHAYGLTSIGPSGIVIGVTPLVKVGWIA